MWSHYSFTKSTDFTNSLNEASPFRNRSGGGRKSARKGSLFIISPGNWILQMVHIGREPGWTFSLYKNIPADGKMWELQCSPISKCFSTLQQLTRHVAMHPAGNDEEFLPSQHGHSLVEDSPSNITETVLWWPANYQHLQGLWKLPSFSHPRFYLILQGICGHPAHVSKLDLALLSFRTRHAHQLHHLSSGAKNLGKRPLQLLERGKGHLG